MISIVMAYCDRLQQCIANLKNLEFQYNTQYKKPFEVVIFDDGSKPDQRIAPHIQSKKYPFRIRLVESPTHIAQNPCKAYNAAFKMATGDKIIIQNPECVHIGCVLNAVDQLLNNERYLSFNCLSLLEKTTMEILPHVGTQEFDMRMRMVGNQAPKVAWYNHDKYNPTNYHFTTAITRKNLAELGGFDERYADGKCFDDNEFVFRVMKKGLHIIPVTLPFVIHLWHPAVDKRDENWKKLWEKNRDLFNNVTMSEISWAANQS